MDVLQKQQVTSDSITNISNSMKDKRCNLRQCCCEFAVSIFVTSCRFWQDLGYLIVYVTGRPDMQKQRVVAWLSQHNFPHGIVSFCDGLVHDPLRHKANFLKSLINDVRMPNGF